MINPEHGNKPRVGLSRVTLILIGIVVVALIAGAIVLLTRRLAQNPTVSKQSTSKPGNTAVANAPESTATARAVLHYTRTPVASPLITPTLRVTVPPQPTTTALQVQTPLATQARTVVSTATSSPKAANAQTPSAFTGEFNYAEALQKAVFFYDAQRSGKLPADNRVSWRGDSALNDGSDNGHDLTGGWYDAGDNVKFGLPMAASATVLAWGVVDYHDAYQQSGQLKYILSNLKWVDDYFLKAHTGENEFWGQVGDGHADHSWWGSAEVMQMDRPSFKIDDQCPGSDLAGETAAALAASSIVFRATDPNYADTLFQNAESLYRFGDTYRGKYSDCISQAKEYYESSGYMDELTWGAIWLYRATNDGQYLEKAKSYYRQLKTSQVKNTLSWDDKTNGCAVLLATITGDQQYQDDVEHWLDYWTTGYQGDQIAYTPGGLAYLSGWGVLRYTASTAFLAFIYSDWTKDNERKSRYHDFAVRQINYMLGDNPQHTSYEIGFGDKYPTQPHHRNAHGSWAADIHTPEQTRHILYGALVGGPDKNDAFKDDRTNYTQTEVATDYNAGFTSALARMALEYGGTPVVDFPPPEQKDSDYYVEAETLSATDTQLTIHAVLYNHSGWPPHSSSDLSFRYYIDINKLIDAGFKSNVLQVDLQSQNGETISQLEPWNVTKGIYYVEISFKGIDIYPGGQKESQQETTFSLSVQKGTNASGWVSASGWSYQELSGELQKVNRIPVYDNGHIVAGEEPDK